VETLNTLEVEIQRDDQNLMIDLSNPGSVEILRFYKIYLVDFIDIDKLFVSNIFIFINTSSGYWKREERES